MHRSKLEMFEAILEALVKEPLTIDLLAYKASMECNVLKKHLDFLIKNGLVEERDADQDLLYAITERGITVFQALDFQRYLKKISSTLMQIDEAMETLRDISNNEKQSEE